MTTLTRRMPVLVAALLLAGVARPQPITSVEQYFKALLDKSIPADGAGRLATPEALGDAVSAAAPEDLSRALPLIFSAVSSSDKSQLMQGSMALIGVGLRPDSAEVLAPVLNRLYDLLGTPDYAALSLFVMGGLRPSPPPEVLPHVLAFLGRDDRDTRVQAGAVGFLLKHAPGDERTTAAVKQFGARPLNPESRLGLMDAITLLFKGNEQLLPTLAASIKDPNSGVRSRAIEDIARLGASVIGKYAEEIQEIADDPSQPPEVKLSAERAIGEWAGGAPAVKR